MHRDQRAVHRMAMPVGGVPMGGMAMGGSMARPYMPMPGPPSWSPTQSSSRVPPPTSPPPQAAQGPVQWRPTAGGVRGDPAMVRQCGGLRPPMQQMVEEPVGGQTLAHMLRMTGELRAEEEAASPQMTADRAFAKCRGRRRRAQPLQRRLLVTILEEVIERSSEGVTVISDSQAHSVRALLHDHCGARF